jgi:hypothetical protein
LTLKRPHTWFSGGTPDWQGCNPSCSSPTSTRIHKRLHDTHDLREWMRIERTANGGSGLVIREAGVPLLMITTETFLRRAKTYLDAEVSEETADQAKERPSISDPDVLVDPNVARLLAKEPGGSRQKPASTSGSEPSNVSTQGSPPQAACPGMPCRAYRSCGRNFATTTQPGPCHVLYSGS